jgi:hypothetical protein
MRIDFNGNVGIGTTAPSAALEIKGKIAVSATGTPTVSACGTGTSISGNDTRGVVLMGTGHGGPCTITFNTPYTSTPYCVLTGTAGAYFWVTNLAATYFTFYTNYAHPVYVYYICLQ